ncbi:MAG: Fructose dehydrogenase cytochrome subunit [Fimbriimonadaceae bacterium]|nr:Fructose dehydrogenase cytochrome subunit [Fimbriimonadaceae bacterium]
MALGIVVLGTAIVGFTPTEKAKPSKAVARGKYLVTVMGCGDCHSPYNDKGQPIKGREFSGHPAGAPLPTWDPSMLEKGNLATIAPTATAFAGPFGLSVAGNLTPDRETGIGKKTADELVKSWRSGKHWKENRMVLPPMPMHAYKHLTSEDIKAIFAYLMTLKPIKNNCPKSQPAPMPG